MTKRKLLMVPGEPAPRGEVQNNLPIQPTRLIGREEEVEDARNLLAQPHVRLLTLTGPGGVGKTRLATQVAAAALLEDHSLAGSEQAFPDGVCFVPLAPLSGPDLVIFAIMQALELRGASPGPLLEHLKSYLLDKQMLLLLDNFEHVLATAPLLSDLLAGCPDVKIMVTSRERLHLYGEHEYPVPPLSLPGSNHRPDLETLAQCAAVELFLRCAQAISPGFQLTELNAQSIAEICLRLDGLPLAIELAAARITVLPPEELLTRLQNEGHESRLKLLTGGARNLPARQQTLRATIEWSYNLLNPDEQVLFRRLAVFAGGCSLKAMEEICVGFDSGEPEIDALDGVTSLVGKSLLQMRRTKDGDAEHKSRTPHSALHTPHSIEARYIMLETILEYARERLKESADLDSTSDRHLDYFLQLAEEAEGEILGNEQALWLRRLDAEQNNLRAALEWSLSRDDRRGLRLAGALGRYWQNRGFLGEGKLWCARLLKKSESRPEGTRPGIELAKALRTLARMNFEQGDFAEARPIYEKSLAMSRALGDDLGVASTLSGLGSVTLWQGEYDFSLSLYEESIAIGRRLGDNRIVSNGLNLKGTILMLKEEYRAAQAPLEEAMTIDRELGHGASMANALAEQGTVAFHLGEHEKGKALLEESLGIGREVGVEWIVVKCLARLGMIALRQGDPQQAGVLLLEGLARARESGNKRWSKWYLVGLAEVARLRGMVRRAAKLLGASEGTVSAAGAHYEPAMRAEIDRIVVNVRAELDDETFARLWADGRAMTPEETIAYALEPAAPAGVSTGTVTIADIGVGSATASEQAYRPNDLTEREVEVLRLIAAGKSNQEIAQDLVLSLRTVERHISNIYQKIGATGRVARASATAYAHRYGFTT